MTTCGLGWGLKCEFCQLFISNEIFPNRFVDVDFLNLQTWNICLKSSNKKAKYYFRIVLKALKYDYLRIRNHTFCATVLLCFTWKSTVNRSTETDRSGWEASSAGLRSWATMASLHIEKISIRCCTWTSMHSTTHGWYTQHTTPTHLEIWSFVQLSRRSSMARPEFHP